MQTLSLVLGIVVLFAPSGVGAAGLEDIYGDGGIQVYSYPRWVTNPASPGPEVIAKKNYGATNLMVGVHNCNYTYHGLVTLVTTGYAPLLRTSVSYKFCTYSSSTSGYDWSASLRWD